MIISKMNTNIAITVETHVMEGDEVGLYQSSEIC